MVNKQASNMTKKTEKTIKKDIKRNNILLFIIGLLLIIAFNSVGSFYFYRFDLTSEKRHTLSNTTKEIIKELDDYVFFRVYLEGDFPAEFKRLRNSTKEMLDEFRAYSDFIDYEFIDPIADEDPANVQNIYKQLISKGLQPTNLQISEKDGKSQKVIFPGAIATYKEEEAAVQLLNNQIGIPSNEVINNSIQDLEYNLLKTILRLTVDKKPKLGIVEGHGELSQWETGDAAYALSEYYSVHPVEINEKLDALQAFDAIIIANPDSSFSEKDKFIIDQFIMKGGKVLWLIDPVYASIDSLQYNNETISYSKNLNIEDMLFKYGVRINHNLIMDLNALPIPIKTGQVGNQPQFEFMPWFYFPILVPKSSHPIVHNLNAIKTEFASSIDTLGFSPNIKKTVLLSSSEFSRIISTPARVSLDIISEEPDDRLYNQSNLPVAVLLEGNFNSVFTNRIPPEIAQNPEIDFQTESKKNKMIVISDGDIIKNQVQFKEGNYYPLPLGYDRYTGETFGNKDFILNAVNYLTDDSGLLSVRSREIKIRLLDKNKINKEKTYWQLLNTILPVLIILVFATIIIIIRKKSNKI
jgi:ABC-2 type transport system permease protein